MQIKDVEKLKAWLLTKLEPLCDADPAALAKYVVALLRKDKPKSALKELCIDQLEVFLAKETTVFVDRLFRGLDSESYLTGHDPKTPPPSEAPSEAPPTATPPISHSITKAPPSIKPPTAAGVPPPKASGTIPPNRQPQTSSKSHASGTRDGTQTFSMSGSGSGNEKGRMGGSGTRRHSEDPRSREVDDDDRDFRRSRARGGRGGGDRDGRVRGVRGGVTVSREPDSSTGGGRRGVESAGMKGRGSTVSTSVDLRGRRRRGEGEGVVGGVSSTGSRPIDGGSVRRIVRERSGAWQDERSGHSDNRPGRRSWQHRSRSRSNSHSSSSDSSSSTSSSHGHGRKRSRQEWNERSGPSSWGAQGAKRDSGPGNKKTISGEDIMVDGEEKKDGREVKRRCKDYDEKGFCMLGDQCPFDHGIDPVVIGNNIPHTYPPPPSMVGIPSLTLTKPGFLVPAGKVSPTESTTDGYNPEEPGLTATSTSPTSAPSFLPPGPLLNPTALLPRPFPHPPPHHPSHHPPHIQGVATIHHLHPVGTFPPPPLPPPISSSSHHFSHHQPHSHWSRPPLQSFPPLPRQPSDTLIVRKIPRESNTITKLSNHFEKFGTIVNLTVWYGGDPEGALVQYSTPFEARKAHDSAEAVLNNRFIKIYYLRKDMPSYFMPPSTLETPVGVAMTTICDKQPLNTQQQGSTTSSLDYHTPSLAHKSSNNSPASHHSYTLSQTTPTQSSPRSKGPPPLRSTTHSYVSANTTSSISSSTHQTTMNQHKRKIPETLESQEMTKKRFELQKKTGELLQKQINQQKLLILKLEKGGKQMPAEEKKKIMKTLKSLSVNIVKLKNMASEAMEARLKSKQTSTTQLPPPSSPTSPLPYYSASLTEKAQALRQEAHKLGLITSPSQPLSNQATPPPSHQATPTSKWAGGQVKDLRAMLNKKQKSLLVLNAENREQLTAHFDGFGGLVKVEVDPDNNKNLIFSFRHAHLAQKAAKHSSSFNGKPLIMKWYTAQPPSPSPYTHSPNLTTTSTTTLQTTHHPLPPSPSPLPMLPLSNPSNIDTSTNVPSDTTEQVTTPTLATPTLTKLDPEALHLVEDDEEDEESEERSWRR